MNCVEVIGGKKDRKELAQRVIAWYLDTVMPRMKTLDITVNLTKCMEKGAYGYCMVGENNREFEIEIIRTFVYMILFLLFATSLLILSNMLVVR